ncbi:ASKHA domain-containing protein, partial [Chloroflexota bacterium]
MNKSRNQRPAEKKNRARYVWLNVLPYDLWLKVKQGETVWEVLQNTDIELESDCGGMGTCGKCKIKVLSEIDPPSAQDKKLLDGQELKQGIRLACRTKVFRDMTIATIKDGREEEYLKILTTSHHLAHRYIPASGFDPLVTKRRLALSPDVRRDGLADLDAIKLGLGSEYRELKAPLNCLHTLPQKLKGTRFRGTAVLHSQSLLDWQRPGKADSSYGLAFDLGTSTLVGKLFNLADGSEVAVTSCLNSQSRRGADVISRLKYIREHPKGLENLRRFVVSDLNQLTARLLLTAALQPEEIFVAIAAGNTTMQHILLGLSPAGIAEAPFSPVLTDGLVVNAGEVGLRLHQSTLLYMMPMKSGYIGGDLLSFVLTSGVAEQENEIILGLDIGTNGEIFLGNGKRLLTCSAAAGPALEGARISRGMIARAGA